MNLKYFNPTPKTYPELKKMYRKLIFIYHPDAGGTNEEMVAVKKEYERLFPSLKDIHEAASGETYTKETSETPEQFLEIMEILIRFEGVTIEIIGSFVWVSGDTKPYKDQLKEMSFRWSPNKSSWYLAPEDYKRRSHKTYTMNDIRGMYGSQDVETQPYTKVTAAV